MGRKNPSEVIIFDLGDYCKLRLVYWLCVAEFFVQISVQRTHCVVSGHFLHFISLCVIIPNVFLSEQ